MSHLFTCHGVAPGSIDVFVGFGRLSVTRIVLFRKLLALGFGSSPRLPDLCVCLLPLLDCDAHESFFPANKVPVSSKHLVE